jgi:asparagine synthetase B (glutamine-hydrolysing)
MSRRFFMAEIEAGLSKEVFDETQKSIRRDEFLQKMRDGIRRPRYRNKEIPVVAISGGIDSSVVLYHVREVYDKEVRALTVSFGNDKDEVKKAEKVADHFNVALEVIKITRNEMLIELPKILAHYPFPRYNVWPWFLVKQADLGSEPVRLYIGEGGDELFGYADRSYLAGWAGQLVWVWPAWAEACKYYGVELHAPFKEIEVSLSNTMYHRNEDGTRQWTEVDRHEPTTPLKYRNWELPEFSYFKVPDKEILRDIYKGLLPEFILETKSTPPSHGFYKMMDMTEEQLQILAAESWLYAHKWK